MTGDPVEEHPTQLHRAQWSSWTLAQKPLIVLASQHFGWVTKLLSKFIVLTLLGCAVTRIDEIYRIYRHQFYAHLQQQTATIAFYFAMVALPDLVYRIVIWPAISAVENLFRIDPSEQSQIFGWTLRQDLAGSDYFRYRAFCKRLEEVFVVDHLAAIEILKSGYHLCMVCLLFSKSLQADVMLMLLLLLALKCLFEPEDTDAKVTRAYLEKSIAEMEHPRPSLHLSSGTVTLRNATFAYNAMTPVLIDVTCTIPGGKITAIVGRTGCGKSTLARLLQRLEVLQSGTIAIDGQDIAKVDPLSVRRNISVITQHTTLFNQSFYVNIGYGRVYTGHLASLAEVKDVAKQCQMYDIINQRPDGFTGSVNNINSRVSGGERQKCLIARAVLKAVPILVLDEATSAMDSKSERALMTLLKSQQHSVTTIIIAHRLPTIIDADNILVMDQGRIVEQGTHETLLQASGLYARMWGYGQDFDPKD
ncbi:mitochondrial ABC iron transporter Atm1 [Dimargaris xerosporica]|nr:mitochondrial ABC iron transporter Atm1 [Dimargaris xerosporica]